MTGTHRYVASLWDGKDLPSYSKGKYDISYVRNLLYNLLAHDTEAVLSVFVDEAYFPHLVSMQRELPYKVRNRLVLLHLLNDHVGGWSPVLNAFSPAAWPAPGERRVMIGLDTVFVGDPSWMFADDPQPVRLPRDPYDRKLPCDALISYNALGAKMIWDRWQQEKQNGMKNCMFAGRPSEMALLRHMHRECGWSWFEDEESKLLSYKVHASKQGCDLSAATAVYFHGAPKPHELPDSSRIKKIWEGGCDVVA